MSEEVKYTLKQLKKKLSDKQKKFCHEYIIDWNGARATRTAGYSERSCRQIATRLLTKDYIKQYLDIIKDDIAKEAGISKLKIINELTKIAFSNITDIFEIKEGNLTLKDPEKKLSEYPKEVTDMISELQTTKDGIRVKLYNKDNGLINLLKAMGWNEPDKVDLKQAQTIEYKNVSKQFPDK